MLGQHRVSHGLNTFQLTALPHAAQVSIADFLCITDPLLPAMFFQLAPSLDALNQHTNQPHAFQYSSYNPSQTPSRDTIDSIMACLGANLQTCTDIMSEDTYQHDQLYHYYSLRTKTAQYITSALQKLQVLYRPQTNSHPILPLARTYLSLLTLNENTWANAPCFADEFILKFVIDSLQAHINIQTDFHVQAQRFGHYTLEFLQEVHKVFTTQTEPLRDMRNLSRRHRYMVNYLKKLLQISLNTRHPHGNHTTQHHSPTRKPHTNTTPQPPALLRTTTTQKQPHQYSHLYPHHPTGTHITENANKAKLQHRNAPVRTQHGTLQCHSQPPGTACQHSTTSQTCAKRLQKTTHTHQQHLHARHTDTPLTPTPNNALAFCHEIQVRQTPARAHLPSPIERIATQSTTKDTSTK